MRLSTPTLPLLAAAGGHHRDKFLVILVVLVLLAAVVALGILLARRRREHPQGQALSASSVTRSGALVPEDPTRRSVLGRLARWSGRHPGVIAGTWVAALLFATIGSELLGGVYSDNFTLPSNPAQQGANLLKAHRPSAGGQASGQIVFTTDARTLETERAAIEQAVANVRRLPDVLSASDPFGPLAVSPNGRTAYSSVHFTVNPQSLGAGYVRSVDTAVTPARHAGVAVDYGGQLGQAARPKSKDPESVEIGLAIALVVLLLGFGSVYGAGVPLVSALAGAFTGFGILGMVAAATTFATASPTLAIMMGLGVGIDYALFLTTRHRQLVMEGTDPVEAAAESVRTSGRAVLTAAVTVVVALLSLSVSGIDFIGKLGLAAAITVAVAALGALTAVPALLATAGRRIDRLHLRSPVAEASGEHAGWQRYAERLGAHPWRYLLSGVALLVLMAIPMFSMHLGHLDASSDPAGYTDKKAYEAIKAGFGVGANGPFTIVAELDTTRTSTPSDRRALARSLQSALAATPDVAEVTPVRATSDGALLSATVIPASGPRSSATVQLMNRLQNLTLPGVLAPEGAKGYVSGSLAAALQFVGEVGARLPLIIATVLAAAFLLLLLSFRSPILALKAAILNLLSIGAAYGVVVAVFQWGWGDSVLGLNETVPVESYVPMMMFAIVFGLSMDYEVFLLSRVREAFVRTGDNHESVAHGLAATARVISCAALIMASVFLSFLASNDVVVKMLALGLGVSVLVDATVIRLLVVPTTMFLLGKYNWWVPPWLDRVLPRFDHGAVALGDGSVSPAGRNSAR